VEDLRRLPGWRKVDFKGRVPHSEVRSGYQHALVGLALNSSTQLGTEGSLGNTKLFEYMEAGLAVVCTNYRLWRDIVETHKCGICVDPHNVDEISEAIKYLVDHPERAIEMGKNGRNAVLHHYNWDTQKEVLLSLYASLVEKA
jgi:glycosyltransferase involved in cell wall biosynthesis